MADEQQPINGFGWIVGLALVLRVSVALLSGNVLNSGGFLFGDSQSYWTLAEQLATGKDYEYGWEHARCFRMPGYPLLLASLFRVFGDSPPLWSARLLSALAGTLSVALAMLLARATVGRRAAFWAGIGVAIYPELLLSGAVVLSEAVFGPLLLGQLLALLATLRASSRDRGLAWAAMTGLLGSLAVLVRPSWALAMPILVLILLVYVPADGVRQPGHDESHRLKLRWRALSCLAFSLLFALPLVPWWARNYALYERFVPTTLQTGASLYDGWNPTADGGSNMADIDERRIVFLNSWAAKLLPPAEAQAWAERLPSHRQDANYWQKIKPNVTPLWAELQQRDPSLPAFEYAFDHHLQDLAISWAAEHPTRAAVLGWEKILRTWSPFPGPMWRDYRVVCWGLAIGFTLLAIMFGLGSWLGRRQWRDAWILVFPALYFTAIHAIFVGSIRYREPALYGLIVLAGITAASLAERLSLGNRT